MWVLLVQEELIRQYLDVVLTSPYRIEYLSYETVISFRVVYATLQSAQGIRQ